MIYAILAVNCCLIGLHIVLRFVAYFDFHRDVLFHPDLLITAERGYPEMFNYFQLAALVWLMLHVFALTRQPIYASLGIIFLLALAHDALQVHEAVGGYAERIDLRSPSSLEAQHFGEFLHWLAIAALAIGALIYGFVTSGAEDRKIGGIFILWIFMLGFCAAVLDAAHEILLGRFFGSNFILGTAEDGGEMLTVALALSTALLLFRHLDDLRRPARPAVRKEELLSYRSRP